MVDLWIPITVAAALLQCIRTAQQRALKPALSNNGANYVRYLFGAPIAASLLIGLMLARGDAAPAPNAAFLAWALTGGIAQIVATSALLMALSLRNFAVGTAFAKTEAVQTAIIGGVLLGEHLSGLAWVAIAVGVVGVIALSAPPGALSLKQLRHGLSDRAAVLGLLSGGLFGVSGVAIRAASLSLPEGDVALRTFMTLATITGLQVLLMTVWLALREPGQFRALAKVWPRASSVGIMSVVGSAGWFAAMTMQNAAYVRALGQVELIFTILIARFWLRERPSRRDLFGTALIGLSVIGVLLAS
jgi:drug/metabolite transporter (DMT)-like permease